MSNRTLTAEQQRLVLENIWVAGAVIRDMKTYMNITPDNLDDFNQMAYEAMCEAACDYDPSGKRSFSTYAYTRIKWEFQHWKIKSERQIKMETELLDGGMASSSIGSYGMFGFFLDALRCALHTEKLSERQRMGLLCLLGVLESGMTTRQLGRKYGCSIVTARKYLNIGRRYAADNILPVLVEDELYYPKYEQSEIG